MQRCRNGTWNDGGHCDTSTAPETDHTKLETEPLNNQLLFHVARQMESERRRVQLLNITYLTEFRKDGHPSRYREPGTPQPAPQDCSHWCLPGVPDTWNELLYAQLLAKGFRTRSKWKRCKVAQKIFHFSMMVRSSLWCSSRLRFISTLCGIHICCFQFLNLLKLPHEI